MLGAWTRYLLPGLLSVLSAGTASAQELVIQPQFESAGTFSNDAAPVQAGGLWGLVNTQGTFVVNPVFDAIRKGEDGRWGARLNGLWGFFLSDGTEVTPFELTDLQPYRAGLAAASYGDDWFMIDMAGWPRTWPQFAEVADWDGSIIIARDGDGWASFDLNQSHPTYRRSGFDDEITDPPRISENTMVVRRTEGYALLDGTYPYSRTLISRKRFIRPMSEGMAAVQDVGGRWGFFHQASIAVLWPGRFEGARNFSQGFAPVKIAGKWGYINRVGDLAAEPEYDDAYPFRNGYAVVRQGDLRGFLRIGPTGLIEEYVAPQFEDVFRFVDGYAPVKIGGLWGFLWDSGASQTLLDVGLTEILP